MKQTLIVLLLAFIIAYVKSDTRLVTTDALNVRKTACTTGDKITTLPKGTVVTFKGEKATGTREPHNSKY